VVCISFNFSSFCLLSNVSKSSSISGNFKDNVLARKASENPSGLGFLALGNACHAMKYLIPSKCF